MIPDFEEGGNLPPGIHLTTWDIFVARFGITPHRTRLISGLKRALNLLRTAGCRRAYIDGSFVTSKQHPNDFDACWDPTGIDLSRIDPIFFDFRNQRQRQKIVFFGELFPSCSEADEIGRRFLEFFQSDKNSGNPKGIIALNVQELP